ncbi:MAG: TatD family hydrolase [Francisellaceae bacterium]
MTKPYDFIDTHCHLDFAVFDNHREQLLQRCAEVGIRNFINPAVSFNNWQHVITLSLQYPQITPALGLHPCFIEEHHKHDTDALFTQLTKHDIKLIGEIGLDARMPDYNRQKTLFIRQLDIAVELKKPVIIHSVRAHNDTLMLLKSSGLKNGGIIHAFTGSYETACQYIKLGFTLGIGSILSYPHSRLQTLIPRLPLDDMVLETDAPDMPLFQNNESVNTPLTLIETFRHLCTLRTEDADIIASQLYNNSLKFI